MNRAPLPSLVSILNRTSKVSCHNLASRLFGGGDNKKYDQNAGGKAPLFQIYMEETLVTIVSHHTSPPFHSQVATLGL